MEATYLKVVGSHVRTPGAPVRITGSARLKDSRPCLSEAAGDARQDPSLFPQSGPTLTAPSRRSDRARFARFRGPRPIETTNSSVRLAPFQDSCSRSEAGVPDSPCPVRTVQSRPGVARLDSPGLPSSRAGPTEHLSPASVGLR